MAVPLKHRLGFIYESHDVVPFPNFLPMELYKGITCTVSHFSYAPLFQGPHFLTKMLESNILYDYLLIGILSV